MCEADVILGLVCSNVLHRFSCLISRLRVLLNLPRSYFQPGSGACGCVPETQLSFAMDSGPLWWEGLGTDTHRLKRGYA